MNGEEVGNAVKTYLKEKNERNEDWTKEMKQNSDENKQVSRKGTTIRLSPSWNALFHD